MCSAYWWMNPQISLKRANDSGFRFVDKEGIVKKKIIGLIHVPETSSASMKCVVDSLFAKHRLSIKKLRGQGYNGASNMKGEFR